MFKGSTCLEPEERLCLIALSEGGEDAVTYREFDLAAGAFVPNGFMLPRSKQDATWVDKDTLLVSRDWGTGTLTQSGYAFVLKRLRRGQPLAQAEEVYRGAASDQVSTGAGVLTDAKGNRAVVITRGTTFFGHETLLLGPAGPVKLDVPPRTEPIGLIDGLVIFRTSDPWGAVPAGAIASAPLVEVERGVLKPTVIVAPRPRQSIDGAAATRDTLLVTMLDEVNGRAFVYTHAAGGWHARPIPLGDKLSVGAASTTDRSDHAYLSASGFLTPAALYSLDTASAAAPRLVKQLPPKFDASGLVVEQYPGDVDRRDRGSVLCRPPPRSAARWFDADDHDRLWRVRAADDAGLFGQSTGKLWLERGGAYVLANIRGGGEFGPAWHDAGRKTKRQVIYDDFASVAKDLIARRITSPAKLGIYGGSNGGLLMGVEFNQHPDLWKAVTIQVPLLDMIRYEHIAAGASWVDEYGSPTKPDELAFLKTISPYQNLKKGVAYPEPYIWTTTKDDRVGPQHARKFAARMQEYGLPYLYYEDTAGGHSGDADIEQGARLQAMQMVYFSQKLIGPAPARTAVGAVSANRSPSPFRRLRRSLPLPPGEGRGPPAAAGGKGEGAATSSAPSISSALFIVDRPGMSRCFASA